MTAGSFRAERRRTRSTLRALSSIGSIDRRGLDRAARTELHVFVSSVWRRWALVALVTLLSSVAAAAGLTPVGQGVVWACGFGFAAVNFSLSTAPKATGFLSTYVVIAVILDSVIATSAVVFLGPGIPAVFFILALLPYAAADRPGQRIGHAGLATAGYLGGAWAYSTWIVGSAVSGQRLAFEAPILFLVLLILRWRGTRLAERMVVMRDALDRAAAGVRGEQILVEEEDDLGAVEESFNRFSSTIWDTAGSVSLAADNLVRVADRLAQVAAAMSEARSTVRRATEAVASELDRHRSVAQNEHRKVSEAAASGTTLRDRSRDTAPDAERVLRGAHAGRDLANRLHDALLELGEDADTTARTVQGLRRLSDRIGAFVHSISRIARQTHVLALNAAIEAAHAGAQSDGFTAVANEVRSLAATASESAREADDAVSELRDAIDALTGTVEQRSERIETLTGTAGDARKTTEDVLRGLAEVGELVVMANEVSMEQVERLTGLSERVAEMASGAGRTSLDAQAAVTAVERDEAAARDVETTVAELRGFAVELRNEIRVLRGDSHAAEGE